MYQPQEMIQSWVNGWVYGVKKSFEVQEQLAKQAEQAFSLQQAWVKQGMEQQQNLLQQWTGKWGCQTDNDLNKWGAPNTEWMQKGWEEQEKALNHSWSQFQSFLKQAAEQQVKGKEQVISLVEETGEKLKQWAQLKSPQI